MIFISGCLCGIPCRYDGKCQPSRQACQMVSNGEAQPICPEVLGGLVRPNDPAEIVGGSASDVLDGHAYVMTRVGKDVTDEFLRGAYTVLDMCHRFCVDTVYLKTRSPSCGIGSVYDGSFSGRLVTGNGVTAELLSRNGITVIPMDKD